jgi:hypothetical protein
LWGTLQGAGIATYQYWKRLKRPLPRIVANVMTFAFVNLTMIVFRSPSVATALRVSGRLVSSSTVLGVSSITRAIPLAALRMVALPIVLGSVAAFAGPTSSEIAESFRPSRWAALGVAALVTVSVMFMLAGAGSEFVYRAF